MQVYKSLCLVVHIPVDLFMLMDEIYRYMPEEWRERMTDLPDNAKRDINNINTELVKRLHSKDTAFSLGKYSRKKNWLKYLQ